MQDFERLFRMNVQKGSAETALRRTGTKLKGGGQAVDDLGIERDGAEIPVARVYGLPPAGAGCRRCAGPDAGDLSGGMAGHRPLSARL